MEKLRLLKHKYAYISTDSNVQEKIKTFSPDPHYTQATQANVSFSSPKYLLL
jgi:hypothetical protein